METPFGSIDVRDAHAHFFSHHFFTALASQSPLARDHPRPIERVGEVTGWTMPPEGPADLADVWVEELGKRGVSSALLIASIPGDEASIAAAVAAHPTHIHGGFMVDPTAEDAVTRVAAAFDDKKLRIACLFPAMHRFSIAETDKVRAIAALAAERPRTAVFVHFGALSVGVRGRLGLPSRFDLRYSNPVDLHALASEIEGASFIIPHFGAGMFREALMVARLCPNVYLDTSSSNAWIDFTPGVKDLADVFKRALDVVGPKRLLFGTDSSFFPRGWNEGVFKGQCEAMAQAGVTNDDARLVLGDNLARLLDVKNSRG
jgi:predicted TIM-barrel fold metal-dependent hydrolase